MNGRPKIPPKSLRDTRTGRGGAAVAWSRVACWPCGVLKMTTASERPAASDGLTSTTFQVRSWFQPNICLRNALKVASPGSGPCELADAPAVVSAGGFNVIAGGCCAVAQRLAKAKAVVINTTVQRFMVPFSCLKQMCKPNVQG